VGISIAWHKVPLLVVDLPYLVGGHDAGVSELRVHLPVPSERARSKRLPGVRPAQRLGVGAEVVVPSLDRCRCIVVSRWVPQLGGPCIGTVRGPVSRTVPAGPATASLASHCGRTTSWDGSHVVAEAVIIVWCGFTDACCRGGCWARASIVDLFNFL
jgi:hypothetical protein